MKRTVEVEIKDTKVARSMLEIAGYYNARQMTDSEVFNTVLHMIECYGAECKIEESTE